MRLAISITLSLLGSPVAFAQAPPPSGAGVRLRHLFLDEAPTPFLNGGVLVIERGRIVYRASMGLADYRLGTKITDRSLFQVASMAKPFTSTAILQLRDAGKLRLDDPVTHYLPGFPFSGITIRHLLSHTSGLPDLELFEDRVAADPGHLISGADLIPALRGWKKPLAAAPGERFAYSNVNYQLLALLVAKVARQPFGDYVRRHIFAPAGMRFSYVLGSAPLAGRTDPPVTNHMHVVMYRVDPEDVSRLDLADARKMRPFRYELGNLGRTIGDQNLFTTLDDLARFDRALTSGKLLSRTSQEEAYAPTRLNDGTNYLDAEEYQLYGVRCSYGLGWEVCNHPRYGRIVGHAGYNRGIFTMLYRNLDRGQLIAMFDNGDTAGFSARFASVANVLNDAPALVFDRRKSLTRAYGEELVRNGPTAALLLYGQLLAQPSIWATTRGGMNALGYDLLRNGYPALALEPFRLNVIAYPNEAGVYDSYGEALAANGALRDAARAYRRSLALKPGDAHGVQALQEVESRIGSERR